MSGDYPAVINGANGRVFELPGSSVSGDSGRNRRSWVLDVEYALAELSWINLSIICASAEIWACRGSRLTLILFSIKSGENFVLASLIRSATVGSDAALDCALCADNFGRVFKL